MANHTLTGRDLARAVLARVAEESAYANRALSAALDRQRALSSEDRALTTELVYGVLRRQARLDRALEAVSDRGLSQIDLRVRIALRVAAYQILFLDRIPAYAAVNDAVEACKAIRGGRLAGLANALLRRVAERGEPPLPDPARDPLGYVVEAAGFPEWMARLVIAELPPAEVVAFADASTAHAPLTIRANRLRTDRQTLAARLLVERPGAVVDVSALAADALLVRKMDSPFVTDAWREGWFAVEDAGAQRVVALAGAAPGERILDACAGVGGKSAHLAALADGKARIDAVDIASAKLDEARRLFARLGVGGVTTRAADLTEPWTGERGYDRVLLDAPCSGLGVLRRHPEALARRQPDELTALAEIQARLLDTVAPLVRAGGTLTYSVCTFERAEGDDVVARFLERHPAFRLDEPAIRTWPHRDDADAFFAVRLRATG
ncbi:MAG TPA: 16S rRNA (cytosine(967)-C(5))-methyltransferase RsmB [Polyangia bacterium]|jgi:16S rRNA (cytosine967-C5)-methyltransferase|nr:16S rRNA (cytosine(967)-C(5))-methyltransferase RsmB [Polyangia bacterium]